MGETVLRVKVNPIVTPGGIRCPEMTCSDPRDRAKVGSKGERPLFIGKANQKGECREPEMRDEVL
jgi:hypothetical protein